MAVRTVPEPTSTFIPVPSGVYLATIQKIESEWKDADQFHEQSYEQIAVTWEIDPDEIDDDEEREGPMTLRSWFTPSMNEKSNLVKKLLPAIGVKAALPLEEWDEQDWVGLSCQIQVERFTNASGFERNKIVGYLAVPKKKKRAAPVVEREEEEEEF
jgi:hypothetical protein